MQDTERELEAKNEEKKGGGGDQAERPITCENLNKIDYAAIYNIVTICTLHIVM